MTFTRIPSRQALRHLSRLCRNSESVVQTPCPRTQHVLRTRHTFSRSPVSRLQQPQVRDCGPLVFSRAFTRTHSPRVQPSTAEPDADPQNTSSPSLPDITNYYTLFPTTLPNGPPGPPPPTQDEPQTSASPPQPTFTIHVPTLRKEFLRLQSIHHPDKYQTDSPMHRKALALSAFINAAYKTLSDPLLRAQYLLQLQYDIDVTSEDNAAHPTDQATLMEVMEAQERVEEATKQVEVDEIKGENERRIVETERVMGAAFEEGNVEAAKTECVRLKYWKSLQGALNEWEPGKEVRLIH